MSLFHLSNLAHYLFLVYICVVYQKKVYICVTHIATLSDWATQILVFLCYLRSSPVRDRRTEAEIV